MKSWKQRICLVTLLCLLLTSTAGGGALATGPKTFEENGATILFEGTKVSQEPITLRGFGSKFSGNAEWDENMLVFKELAARTNVHIEWETVVHTESRTKAQALFAADDLPDLFLKGALNTSDVVKFAAAGQLIDLRPFMDEGLMPNFKAVYDADVNVRLAVTQPDGKIYSLPAYYTDPIDTVRRFLYINEKWLRNVGMEKPQTLDEFYAVLKAFKDQDANGNGDPNDEYPLSLGNVDAQLEKTSRALAGIDDIFGVPLNIVDGQLTQQYTDEKMKTVFKFLHKAYSEGYLEDDIFTRTSTDSFARLSNDQIGISELLPPGDSSDWGALEPKFALGDAPVIWNWKVSTVLNAAAFSITSANKNPKATARWIDYFYSDEGARLIRLGVEGDTYVKNADGSYSYSDKVKNDPEGVEFAMGKYSFWLQPNVCPGKYTAEITSALFEGTKTLECVDLFAPYYTKYSYSMPQLDPEITKERTAIQSEITKYINEARAAYMTGAKDVDADWEQYVSDLKKIGVDRLEEIYRQAYEIVKQSMGN